MTLVNTETGEIVETLTTDEARRLTDRIRLIGDGVADALDKMADLIDQARTGSAWLALGYRSWTEYVATEFTGLLPRLDREPRAELVRDLAARGMSVRAIAPVVGVSKSQVAADVSSSGHLTPVSDETSQTPEGGPFTDAPTSPASDEGQPHAAPARPPVTGIDGKTYTPPTAVAPKPSRSPEQVNAEENSQHLGRSLLFLLAFQHPNMRDHMRSEWQVGRFAVSPTNRGYVTPNHMREAAAGLAALADEWESQ